MILGRPGGWGPSSARVALSAAALLLVAGCATGDAQREFELEAMLPPSGITETRVGDCAVGTVDPDDWRSAPLFPTVGVEPACPNPVPRGYTGPITVGVNAPFPEQISSGLRLLIWDPRPPTRLPAQIAHIPPGAVFHFNTLSFSRADVQIALALADAQGLYRLYLRDGAGRLISFGDLRVE